MFFSKNNFKTFGDKAPPKPTSSNIIVREGFLSDVKQVLSLATRLRLLSPNVCLRGDDKEITLTNYRMQVVNVINGNGILLIAENCNGIQGYIVGNYSTNVWSDNAVFLNEFGFYALSKIAGVKLLKVYLEKCVFLKSSGKIQFYTMGYIPGVSPDYSKLGMRPAETIWVA